MRKKSEKILHKGKFLSLKESVLVNRDGRKYIWESVVRNKRTKVAVVIARMKPSGRYVLIRQYRPPIDNYVLGMPAGLVRGDVRKNALRELKEETGYKGRVIEVSPRFKLSPAVMDDDVFLVEVEIDEKDKANRHPIQELEPEEQIEVVLAKKSGIRRLIASEIRAGREVASALWYFLLGGDL